MNDVIDSRSIADAVSAAARAFRYPPVPALAEDACAGIERRRSGPHPPLLLAQGPAPVRQNAHPVESGRRRVLLALAMLLLVACVVLVYLSSARTR